MPILGDDPNANWKDPDADSGINDAFIQELQSLILKYGKDLSTGVNEIVLAFHLSCTIKLFASSVKLAKESEQQAKYLRLQDRINLMKEKEGPK